MKLRITTPEGRSFMSGMKARTFLDDVEISQYVSRLVLTVDAEEPIRAEVTLFLTGVDVDVAAVINIAAEEEQAALSREAIA